MYGKNRVPVLRIAFTLISAAVLCVSSFASEQAPGGKRYAILVGINEYADSAIVRLSTPRNDAKDLGELLSSDGWDKVFILRDDVDYRNPDFPSRTNIENRVHLLADLVKPEDTIFFFFSGHGISTERGSSILPVDAAVNRIADTGISLSSLLSVFTDRGLRKLVVAVDACREEVSTTKGLSIVGIAGNGASGNGAVAGAPVGGVPALTLYATKAGWYSYEDAGGRNGVFTRFMLEGLSGKADSAGNGDVTFAELAPGFRMRPPRMRSTAAFANRLSLLPAQATCPPLKFRFPGCSPDTLLNEPRRPCSRADLQQAPMPLERTTLNLCCLLFPANSKPLWSILSKK